MTLMEESPENAVKRQKNKISAQQHIDKEMRLDYYI